MENEMRPYTKVKVGFDYDYANAITTYSNPRFHEAWEELGDLLAFRSGWHCDVVNQGELLWSFGVFGGSLLNIGIHKVGIFACFDYHEDCLYEFETIGEVSDWLDKREEKAKEKDIKESKSFLSPDGWKLLRNITFDLEIDWFPDTYVGVVRGSASEATFAESLSGVIHNAREMLINVLGAEHSIVTEIKFKTTLTIEATTKFLVEKVEGE